MRLKAALASMAVAGSILAAPLIPVPTYAADPTPGPQAVVDSATVAPGGTITVTSVTPCDLSSPEASAVAAGYKAPAAVGSAFRPGAMLWLQSVDGTVTPAPSWAPGRVYLYHVQDGADQAADGSWQGTLKVPADFPLGAATLQVSCNLGDYIGTTYLVYQRIDIMIALPAPASAMPAPTAIAHATTAPASPVATAATSPAPPPSPAQSDFPWWLILLLLLLVGAAAIAYESRRRRRAE